MERIAIVTGAGSGIGRACALALLADGWQVALLGRRAEALEATRAAAGTAAARAHVQVCDVSDDGQVAQSFDAVAARHGRLDLLFNNAGGGLASKTPDLVTAEEWRRVVEVNLNGAFYCLSHAFRLMKAQQPMGGRIINNGSISAHAPRPGSIAYTATKHAVSGLTARMADGVPQADGSIRPEPRMDLQAVADTFMAMVRLPLSANVLFATVMATKMPFIGRG
jgi:NAD(P)-dependent dehydrogenase (short-subunit alcohol dehydrogenase family)